MALRALSGESEPLVFEPSLEVVQFVTPTRARLNELVSEITADQPYPHRFFRFFHLIQALKHEKILPHIVQQRCFDLLFSDELIKRRYWELLNMVDVKVVDGVPLLIALAQVEDWWNTQP